MSEHSKGPWTYERSAAGHWRVWDAEGTPLADVLAVDERDANGRMMGAALEMGVALVGALDAAAASLTPDGHTNDCARSGAVECVCWAGAARAALKKAGVET